MDYLKLFEESYKEEQSDVNSKLEYLSFNVFGFITYDGGIDDLFARKAVEVCKAITLRETFEYIKDPENYKWYLIMCNMPFFKDKLNWGGSIRGAWWGAETSDPEKAYHIQSTGLFYEGEQLCDVIYFTDEEWIKFIRALIEFAGI
jgi:hypothetical protein